MERRELDKILADHKKWLANEGGARADLRGAALRWADLREADLREADLSWANLHEADLSWADLREADLSWVALHGADLRWADLREVCLREADLREADLSGANLHGVDLPGFQIPQTGTLDVFKKVEKKIVKLRIPAKAKRTASLVGRKCRAEYVKVLDIEGGGPVTSNGMRAGPKTTYEIGKVVKPDSYDDDIRIECSHGIHFFLTREEAEEF